MGGGGIEIRTKDAERAVEPAVRDEPHQRLGELPGHLEDPRNHGDRYRMRRRGDYERGLDVISEKKGRDVSRDALRFDDESTLKLRFKDADARSPITETALVPVALREVPLLTAVFAPIANVFSSILQGALALFGRRPVSEIAVERNPADFAGEEGPREITVVTSGAGARASILQPEPLPGSLDPAQFQTIVRADQLLTIYDYENPLLTWGANQERVRLESLASSPWENLSSVQEAREVKAALDRLSKDRGDVEAMGVVDHWYSRHDAPGGEDSRLVTEALWADYQWNDVNNDFVRLREVVEEPLMTELSVYHDPPLSPELTEFRAQGDVLGVDVKQARSIDVAAARADGFGQIPAGEMTIWVKPTADIGAMEDAVMRALPEGLSVRAEESQFAFSVGTESTIIVGLPGADDLRFVIHLRMPS